MALTSGNEISKGGRSPAPTTIDHDRHHPQTHHAPRGHGRSHGVREHAGDHRRHPEKRVPKGDVFEAARIAGLFGIKRTADMIPDCHPLPVEHAEVTRACGTWPS
jgi:hypothetical protein